MKKPRIVTDLQLLMCIATTVIGVGILAIPRITVEYTATGASMSTFFGAIIALIAALILAYLGGEYPNQSFFEYSDHLISKWLGGLITLAISLYFMELAALAAREFGEVVITSVLPRTPLEVTVFIMLMLATISSRGDIAVFSRTITFFMPLVYFPALVIVALTLKSAKLTNIFPTINVFYETTWGQMILSSLTVCSVLQNFMIIGILTPYMYQPKKALKSVSIGMTLAGILYLIFIFATLSVFGFEEIKNLLWPTLELAKTAAFPTLFFERMDPIFIAVWVTAVFTAILSSYYITLQGLSHLLRIENHTVLTFLMFPIIFVLAMQPSSELNLYDVIKRVGIMGLPLTVGFPILLFAIHQIKKIKTNRQRSGSKI
jgi:spore germination protein